MKFIVTNELGRLAKWLRIMGFDTVYHGERQRTNLVIESLRDDRIILTRDSKMSVYSGTRMLHIKSDFVEEQVKQVFTEIGIRPEEDRFFTICVLCNKPLSKAAKNEVKDKVPPYVYETQDTFMKCNVCNRIYWQGTHLSNVKELVAKRLQLNQKTID